MSTVVRLTDLQPGSIHHIGNHEVQTLDRPDGELLCRFGTVNDLHFGEVECGRIDDDPRGPIQRAEPGEPPYPQTMNRAAVAEMADAGLAAVVVKGDISTDGTDEEFAGFEACYRAAFGDRLHVVRGNHDAYRAQHVYTGDQWIDLPGVVDRSARHGLVGAHDGLDHGTATGMARRPCLGLPIGRWWCSAITNSGSRVGGTTSTSASTPTAATVSTMSPHDDRRIVAYAAGHTHRHRVRPMACGVPSIEVGCVKDFPGTWAEYRVYEGGVMQVVHRMSSPEALNWSERCRHLMADFGIDYESYAMGNLEDRCFNIPLR